MSSPILTIGRAVTVLLSAVATTFAAAPGGAAPPNRASSDPPALNLTGPVAATSTARDDDSAGRLLDAIERRRRLISGQVRAEVDAAVREARSRVARDPRNVASQLKLTLERVLSVPELSADTCAQLRVRLESVLREASRRAAVKELVDTQTAIRRAAARAQLHSADALLRDQQRTEQLMDRFQSLMDERHYTAAQSLASGAIADLNRERPVGASAGLTAQMTGAQSQNAALRDVRQQALVNTLAEAETSHVPFADDQPMIFPEAAAWESLSRRRLNNLHTDQRTVGPLEARIREQLRTPTSVEFIETPLAEAVDYLKDLHGIEIQLDVKALEEAGISGDVPIGGKLNGVSLRTALRLILRPLDLTYLVEDEVLLITTVDVASQKIVAKVYPVDDLVVPIMQVGMGTGGLGSGGPSGNTGSGLPGSNGPGLNLPGLNGPGQNGPGGNLPF